MGKKTSRKRQNRANVLPIKQYLPEKPQDVKIVPRNVNQESYLLKLLSPSKDIVFGVGPAGTGKTLIAVQVAIKMFKEKQVNKIVVTRPVVSVDEDRRIHRVLWLRTLEIAFFVTLFCFLMAYLKMDHLKMVYFLMRKVLKLLQVLTQLKFLKLPSVLKQRLFH